MDELVALIDAAGKQDAPAPVIPLPVSDLPAGSTRARVADALARGLRPSQIAAALGLSKSTVSFHVPRLEARPVGDYQGRRAVCGALARSGDLRVGHVPLHDAGGARFRIPGTRTEAGVREVQMSPDLVEEFVSHFDVLRRAGKRTDAESYAFPNVRGGRLSRQRVAGIVRDAAEGGDHWSATSR
jgi:DNA-binding transcriptional ArsR family regulator